MRKRTLTKAKKNWKLFLKDIDLSDVKVRKQLSWGNPSTLILNLAEDFEYDFIVIGATGLSRLKQVLIGSTAEKVLRHTPCSLLVIR